MPSIRFRGIMISPAVSQPKSIAREAISPVCSSSEPVFAASSTSSWISSGEKRPSVNVVLSPNGRSTRFELAVKRRTSGLATQASAQMTGAIVSA
jgi:hypothetical protein